MMNNTEAYTTALGKFGELALRSDDLDEILTEACHLVAEALKTDLAKVMELQEGGESLIVRAGIGWKPGVVGVMTISATGDTSEAIVLQTGEPIISPNVKTEKRFSYPKFLIDNGVKALANVVIIGGKNRPPFGILQVDSHKTRQFNENDSNFLRSYANLLAAAVDRLRTNKESRMVENRLAQVQRADAVGRLSAGVAHDFNNVLHVLMGGLEAAIEELDDRPLIRADLETALRAAQRGSRLTSHLLSFTRQQMLVSEQIQLPLLLAQLADTLKRTLGHKIKVAVRVEPNLPSVFADVGHLDAALLNLALNARDAMPDGGLLGIDASCVDGRVIIAISDNGTGMSPDTLVLACDPFFTTKGMGGSGLGLAMVHGFAQQSGGELRITSTPGKGTRVEILLPVAPVAPGPVPSPLVARTPAMGGSNRVLVVDDDPDAAQMVEAFLSKSGFDVVKVHGAKAAIKALEAEAGFVAMITDLAMHDMNGAELVHLARHFWPHMPILVMTGYLDSEMLARIPKDLVVLRKPFSRQEISTKLKDLLLDAMNTHGSA
jgi:signal transduction histidine kinase